MKTFAAAVAACLLLAGCGSAQDGSTAEPAPSRAGQSTTEPTDPPQATESPAKPAKQQVPESLEFEAETVDGQPFAGASLAGKPTLFWFWAPWCPTCRSQIDQVEDLAAEYGDRVNVVGVGSLDDAEAIEEFAGDVEGPVHLADVDGSVWKKFGVTEQSSFVLLDASGKQVFDAGYGGSDDLADRVADLLG